MSNAIPIIVTLNSACTLYMMAILLRWTAPWLELETNSGPMRIVSGAADPTIRLMRRLLPSMGSRDWSPIAALVAVWIIRLILTGQ